MTAAPAQAANRVTPGNFTGYGFDQCVAPTQAAMDAWLTSSPYWAVGIYISGDSRGCPVQPNLNPAWISTQLRKGWRLLPITLGPQAWCTTRERYLRQVRINPGSAHRYRKARAQGRAEARKTVRAARGYGISAGSTLWYDLEAFDIRGRACRESALSFLSAWTRQLHALEYVSGVYSSAASGIKALDDARVDTPRVYAMPDRVWIGDWNGRADLESRYVRSDGWMPHARVHQYRGGHDETYGGVRINIDSNYLSLGRGSVGPRLGTSCGGVQLDRARYNWLAPGTRRTHQVRVLKCLLTIRGVYAGEVDGEYDDATSRAVREYRARRGLGAGGNVSRGTWAGLLAQGRAPIVKYGSARPAVRRLQRALNAATDARLDITGVYTGPTAEAVRDYQRQVGLPRTGVAASGTWARLQAGSR